LKRLSLLRPFSTFHFVFNIWLWGLVEWVANIGPISQSKLLLNVNNACVGFNDCADIPANAYGIACVALLFCRLYFGRSLGAKFAVAFVAKRVNPLVENAFVNLNVLAGINYHYFKSFDFSSRAFIFDHARLKAGQQQAKN